MRVAEMREHCVFKQFFGLRYIEIINIYSFENILLVSTINWRTPLSTKSDPLRFIIPLTIKYTSFRNIKWYRFIIWKLNNTPAVQYFSCRNIILSNSLIIKTIMDKTYAGNIIWTNRIDYLHKLHSSADLVMIWKSK